MTTVATNSGTNWPLQLPNVSENTPFPDFKRKIVGSFSLHNHTEYLDNTAGLRFLRLPESRIEGKVAVNIDLNQSCPAVIREDEECNHINTSELKHLLTWIRTHHEIFQERRPDFVMYRGLMTSLLGTPYEHQDTWCIGAIKRNSTIYLRQLDTEQSLQSRTNFNSDPRLRRFGAWGHHFENFLMADAPEKQPNPADPSNTEFNVMYSARLNQHALLYCGELDGVWDKNGKSVNPKESPDRLPECDLVELKTTRFFHNGQMPYNFRRNKLRKWWCQAFPACISDIVVGYRDDEGQIKEVEILPLRLTSKLGQGWCGTVCFNFLDQFLTEVKSTVKEETGTVFIFTFDPKQQSARGFRIKVCAEQKSSLMLQNLP